MMVIIKCYIFISYMSDVLVWFDSINWTKSNQKVKKTKNKLDSIQYKKSEIRKIYFIIRVLILWSLKH